jgi:hypothetical protein
VHRLHGPHVFALAARFPNLITIIATGQDVLQQLTGGGGVLIAPIIAAGCGHIGNEKAETIAGQFLIEDQMKLLKTIFWLTYPNGLGAFMEAMAGLVTGPISESDKPVKVRLKKSPSASPILSDTGSLPAMQ